MLSWILSLTFACVSHVVAEIALISSCFVWQLIYFADYAHQYIPLRLAAFSSK